MPHLHIEAKIQIGSEVYDQMTRVNVEDFMNTQFDENGNSIENINCQ